MTAPFGSPSADSLAGFVLEVASQLHQERARRIALEEALVAAGLISKATIEAIGSGLAARERTAEALTASMAGLMRVMIEQADPRTPLRGDLTSTMGEQP